MADEDGGVGDLDRDIKTCAVLGGRGFIGRALVGRLLRLGNWIVRVVDAAKSPELEPSETILADAFSSGRAVYFQVDLRDESRIVKAIEGVSVVFYTDSLDSYPSDFYFCYNVIVQGAKNVVNACQECKVIKLIYISSADVVFDHGHDIYDGDESLPYSGQFWDMVTDLRAQAEALILHANDIDGLLTCALRPCNVFGAGDTHLLPMLVNMAKSNWAKFIIGSGNNLSDFTYVENVAYAHICAEKSLSSQMVTVSGKVFFITNHKTVSFWDFASFILGGLDYQRPAISLPAWVAHCIVYLIKLLHVKSDSGKLDLCASVCNIAALASHTRTFSYFAAQKHIQYSPVVSIEEAVRLTVDSFSHLTGESRSMRYKDSNEPSKVKKLLGSGEVADILLWRDEKKTFSSFFFLAFLYYWVFLSGSAFISSVAKLFLLIIILLCAHFVLPLIGPDVVNCSARTGLDLLSKHYDDAIGFGIVSILPDSEEDFASYTEFLRYLGSKDRAGVAKFDDVITLFLVPPSEFLSKVLRVTGPPRLYGVVLKFPQAVPSSPALNPLTMPPHYADAPKMPTLQRGYGVITPEERVSSRVLSEDFKFPLNIPVPVTSSFSGHSNPPTTVASQAGLALSPELIATLTSLLPANSGSSFPQTTSLLPQAHTMLGVTSNVPSGVGTDISHWKLENRAPDHNSQFVPQLGGHFNSHLLHLQAAQTAPIVSSTAGQFHQSLNSYSQIHDQKNSSSSQGATSLRPISSIFPLQSGPEINQLYHQQNSHDVLRGQGINNVSDSLKQSYNSSILHQPEHPAASSNQNHVNTVVSPPQPYVLQPSEVELTHQSPPLQADPYGVTQENAETEADKNERYKSTLLFATSHQVLNPGRERGVIE